MLDSLFKPKSVAVIGASSRRHTMGNRIIENLVDFGFKGEIYPVNPGGGIVSGLKAYKSLLEIPAAEGVDVVHVVVPARFVPGIVDDCAKIRVKNIIINSGGFSETGHEGKTLEKEVLHKAGTHGIRIVGPNCQGIINTDPQVRAYCNFALTKTGPGSISMVALSGGVAELIHQGFFRMGIGTRLYASTGNACDVSIPEIIRYLGDEEGTSVIVTYVEGIEHPGAFLDAAREAAAKKPVLAMKAGRTEEGAKAATSHTGGLATEAIFAELIFKKAGVISCATTQELVETAAGLALQPVPKGNRVVILTNTGGPAVIAADVLAAGGCRLPPLSSKTRGILQASLPSEATVGNPVDVLASATTDHFRVCLETLMNDEDYDAIYLCMVTSPFADMKSVASTIVSFSKQRKKPMVCNLLTDKGEWSEVIEILQQGGVPLFDFSESAARCLCGMVSYHRLETTDPGPVKIFPDMNRDAAAAVIEAAAASGRESLSAGDVYRILAAYGIPLADYVMASDEKEARMRAEEIGYPVVVKVDAPSLIHKSDTGGVALDLKDQEAVASAVLGMKDRRHEEDIKFLVQKYHPGGMEIICGAKAEAEVGHMILFGLGGIHVDILKDVAFQLTPLTPKEAEDMVLQIKAAPLLCGFRGQPGVNINAVQEILLRLSQMVTDLPMIRELDLNPLLAFKERVLVVDARISISTEAAAGAIRG